MDHDLASIQNARDLLVRSKAAQRQFAHASQTEVDRIVDAMARAATDYAEELAKLAVEESGMDRYARFDSTAGRSARDGSRTQGGFSPNQWRR